MHGHRYRIVVKVSADKLNDIGLAYDFTDLKRHLNGILERFDHTCLNDIVPFDKINPSAENIASTIYNELKEKLSADPFGGAQGKPISLTAVEAFRLSEVEVWESPEQGISYHPD
jgi:6-pyruvoyltetrahydropterin/6-carboxytetrahydropterin synthase